MKQKFIKIQKKINEEKLSNSLSNTHKKKH